MMRFAAHSAFGGIFRDLLSFVIVYNDDEGFFMLKTEVIMLEIEGSYRLHLGILS